MNSLEKSFILGRRLASGVDGTVRVITEKTTGHQYACKSVDRSDSIAVLHARAEINMLERLRGHPTIITYHGRFEDRAQLHIVMDLEGNDLCSHLRETGSCPDKAARILKAVVSAIAFCHEREVMHRDIKPDNILLPSRKSGYENVKFADFGTSADFSDRRPFRDVEGTIYYVAPEVLTGTGYDEKVDIWGLGILLYVILSGYLPFHGKTEADIFWNIKTRSLSLNRSPWREISAEAKDLLKGMLQKNPHRRLELAEIMAYPWLNGKETNESDSQSEPEDMLIDSEPEDMLID
ncbi:hypothetical protein KP509_1Z224200 [Ceratopteris richardii]|nr:hypothetical protein KP509_1Z224200 [Ceratopteris richardii]